MLHSSIQTQFTQPLLAWFKRHGRKNLPWQEARTPYRVWLSEIMLQQTQVKTVIPYFLRFTERFKTLSHLAHAEIDEVLALWSGLGYYSRGRNLHQTARILVHEKGGRFPTNLNELCQLPGIGQSTAAAILAQAFELPTPILDGNVKRVLSRYFLVGGRTSVTEQQLWMHANQCMSQEHPCQYTQAIMDLGAICCTPKRPHCNLCPVSTTCKAHLSCQTTNYPTPKPKKSLPTQRLQFLLMHDTQHIYLEKRKSQGIWRGLWCLPCLSMDEDATNHVKETYPFQVLTQHNWTTLQHTLTHLKLEMNIVLMNILRPNDKRKDLKNQEAGFFTSLNISELGLATPIRKIIDQFYDTL